MIDLAIERSLRENGCAIDTCVLVRRMQPSSPLNAAARRAIHDLRDRQYDLYLASQCLREYWATATRPFGENGLGWDPLRAERWLGILERAFHRIEEHPACYPEWRRLVTGHATRGRAAHDANIVAAMIGAGINVLLTFNGTDFARYPEIAILDPRDVP